MSIFKKKNKSAKANKIKIYLEGGRIPWSEGYHEFKFQSLKNSLNNDDLFRKIKEAKLPEAYGLNLDERIVEIPWAVSNLSEQKGKLLDAGSSFNFREVVSHSKIQNKELTILTFDPEENNFAQNRISYVYEDLRDIPFKDECFHEIISVSTIEHIDMDNSIYGWNENNAHIENQNKSYEYLKVISEMLRVLKHKGTMLVTFPFGKFENHGFFQQFDDEMLDRITELLEPKGSMTLNFFRYTQDGWIFTSRKECQNIESFNPHTGKGKKSDGAAHCRSVCCIKFIKL